MTNIFIDTSAFVALLDEKDIDHKRAIGKAAEIAAQGWQTITSDYVLDESYTTILKNAGHKGAMAFDRKLRTEAWKVEWINQVRFIETQRVFRRFNKDKQWSFTDCTSFVVMKELKIKKAFSFDEHFKQMGFELL